MRRPTMPVAWQHVRGPNDSNGNPRRLYLVHFVDHAGYAGAEAYDEGYRGRRAIPEYARGLPDLVTVDVSGKEYRELLARLEPEPLARNGRPAMFGLADVGFYGDATFGHDHVRARIAEFVETLATIIRGAHEDGASAWRLAESLERDMPDDASDEDEAFDLLNEWSTDDVSWGLGEDGQGFGCWEVGPQPGDYVLESTGPLGSRTSVGIVEGKHVGTYTSDDEALEAIRARMAAESYWPDVWSLSDHGNLTRIGPICCTYHRTGGAPDNSCGGDEGAPACTCGAEGPWHAPTCPITIDASLGREGRAP